MITILPTVLCGVCLAVLAIRGAAGRPAAPSSIGITFAGIAVTTASFGIAFGVFGHAFFGDGLVQALVALPASLWTAFLGGLLALVVTIRAAVRTTLSGNRG